MTVLVKVLIPPKYAENVQTTQYTATNCKAVIDKFTVTSSSGSNVTFSANIVTSGGSAGADNRMIYNKTILPNETYTCPELVGQVLEAASFISTLAGAATSLTIRCSGREIT